MTKIPQILLKAYLRRNPVHLRLNQFNFLSRYSWLKNILEELRPEFFPDKTVAEAPVLTPSLEPPESAIRFIGETIQGKLGSYMVERWQEPRGRGQLFEGVCLESGEMVGVKEFLLAPGAFNRREAQARQNRFTNVGLLRLADGRQSHFRAIRPIEAIADDRSDQRCYLITPVTDLSPTLRAYLATAGAVPPVQARRLVAQLLQTLDFLHGQTFSLANGQPQAGLLHGHLGPDTVLWSEQGGEPFLYLCDFQQWEQLFAPPSMALEHPQVNHETIQPELQAVAEIGFYLLQGQVGAEALSESAQTAGTDPNFEQFLRQLINPSRGFASAAKAHQTLLRLPSLYSNEPIVLPEAEADTKPKQRSKFPLLAALSTLVILGGIAWTLRPNLRSSRAAVADEPPVCCLTEISAVPAGRFTYTAVNQGSWQFVMQQQHLLKRGQSVSDAISLAQPDVELNYQPSSSISAALNRVEQGDVDFAIVPLLAPLPVDLIAQPLAYDGLAVVVPFSYAERRKGLPSTLKGEISLQEVEALYSSRQKEPRLQRSSLPIERFAPTNAEAIEVFEQQVIAPLNFQELGLPQAPTLTMLRSLINRFEIDRLGGIGFSSLSQIRGQCSVYPLAIQGPNRQGQEQKHAVQPLILANGEDITPETDLCDRKGNYRPNVSVFQNGDYPLSYPLAVVYASDNRRIPIGRKFAELMQTTEGQQLLSDAGLVPLEDFWTRSQPPTAMATSESN